MKVENYSRKRYETGGRIIYRSPYIRVHIDLSDLTDDEIETVMSFVEDGSGLDAWEMRSLFVMKAWAHPMDLEAPTAEKKQGKSPTSDYLLSYIILSIAVLIIVAMFMAAITQ